MGEGESLFQRCDSVSYAYGALLLLPSWRRVDVNWMPQALDNLAGDILRRGAPACLPLPVFLDYGNAWKGSEKQECKHLDAKHDLFLALYLPGQAGGLDPSHRGNRESSLLYFYLQNSKFILTILLILLILKLTS